MDRFKIIDFINDIEKKIDEKYLVINGDNIWQIIRIYIFQILSRESTSRKPIRNKGELLTKSIKKIGSVSISLIDYLKYRFKNITKVEHREVLFWSSVWYRRVEIEDVHYNPYVDPLIYRLEKEKIKWLLHEYSANNDKFKKSNPFKVHLNQSAILSAQIKSIFSINIRKADYKKIDELTTQINEIITSTGLKIDVQVIVNRLSLYFYLKEYFETLLDKFSPKVIFLVCYYNFYGFALISAAKDKGIKTFDLQHGVQGQNHIAYGRRFLQGNDQLLPDGYIVHTNKDKLNIERYQEEKKVYLLKKQFGDFLEIDLINNKKIKTRLESLKSNSFGKKRVLLSLQYGIGLEGKMKELLEKSKNKDIIWWIRLHPNMKLFEVDEVKKTLQEIGLNNYEISYSSSLPIEVIFSSMDAHITYFSSTALDALEYQKKTIVMAKEATDLFRDEINSGQLIYENNITEILSIIEDGTHTNDFNSENEQRNESFKNVIINLLQSNN